MINRNINIYNIFLRDIENESVLRETIERAQYMGFDSIYFNPFFQTGKSGSIYSIADYYSFDQFSFDKGAELDQQAASMMTLCRQKGLIPIIDLVINHTAIDSRLVETHPDFYAYEGGKVRLASGRDIGQSIVWYDLAQLDYDNIRSGLWDYMLDVCQYYIKLGVGGFRCDAADQVSLAFWIWLIREIRKTDKDVLFIGEAYLCPDNIRIGLSYAGFDYIYNSAKWWDYNSAWLADEYNAVCGYISSISFPDNHDTRRLMDEVGGNTKLFLQHLYFTAFWAQGFEITAYTEFGELRPLDCVLTRRSHREAEKYDFTEHIKELIKVRSFISGWYGDGETWDISFNKKSVQMTKGKYQLEINWGKNLVCAGKRTDEGSVSYVFNCMDSKPSIVR